jgi:uncharacterized protein YjbI with pentapeptide repeats
MRQWCHLLLFGLAAMLASADGNAQGRRLALVIGISNYENPGWNLDLAIRDSETVAEALRKHGNFIVTPIVDPTARLLRLQVEEFAAKIRPGDFVVVYYAGHGIQHRGQNYLLPSDFPPELSQLEKMGLSANALIEQLNVKKPAMKLLILDACRNNPLGGANTGLAAMEPSRSSDTRIEFAAGAGQAASDGLYARHLVKALSKPGLDVDAVFRDVRGAVLSDSDQRQMPYSSGGLTVNFFFVAPDSALADGDRALSLLERTASMMPQGDLGQVLAVESLVRRHHAFNGTRLLQGVWLRSGNFTGGSFAAASLVAADLSEARLMKADFSKADLSFATLRGIAADDANMAGALLVFAELDCPEPKPASGCGSMRRVNAARSVWFGASARGMDFGGADLTGARLLYADLRDAKFNGAILNGTLFIGSDLRGATFEGAKLDNADFALTKFGDGAPPTSGACATPLTLPPGYYGHSLKFELFELIPNPTIRGGTEYRRDHRAEFLAQRFWSPTLPPCGRTQRAGGRWAGLLDDSTLEEDFAMGLEQKLLTRAGLREEIRRRVGRLAVRLYPGPLGRYKLTPREGEFAPRNAVPPPARTYLTLNADGSVQLTQENRTLWRGTWQFWHDRPNALSIREQSPSTLCGEPSRPATYAWIWQDDKTFTMHVDPLGYEPCDARAKLLQGAIFKLEQTAPGDGRQR